MVTMKSAETLLTLISMITKVKLALTTMLIKKNMVKLVPKLYINVHASSRKLSVILSDLIQNWTSSTNFGENSFTCVHVDLSGCEVCCCMRTDGQTDGRPNVRMIRGTARCF